MYNFGQKHLSCIKIPAAKQAMTKNTQKSKKLDLAADHRNLISAANKVFGEGKWNHTIISQTLDFVEVIDAKVSAGCVSFVKVQLENGNFHEDVGYYSAVESTKGLSIHNARIGSAVNALERVLLSFGDKIERELQHLQKPVDSEQINDVQRDVTESVDKKVLKKSNDSVNATIAQFESQHDDSKHIELVEEQVVSEDFFKPQESCTSVPTSTFVKSNTIRTHPVSEKKIQSTKIVESLLNDIDSTSKQESKLDENIHIMEIERIEKQMIQIEKQMEQMEKMKFDQHTKDKESEFINEMRRMKRKKKQMEKQIEFKKCMLEKEGIIFDCPIKPNPRY